MRALPFETVQARALWSHQAHAQAERRRENGAQPAADRRGACVDVGQGPAAAQGSKRIAHRRGLEAEGRAAGSEEGTPHCKMNAPLPLDCGGDEGVVGGCEGAPYAAAGAGQSKQIRNGKEAGEMEEQIIGKGLYHGTIGPAAAASTRHPD
jgi:hypothetical protein